MFIKHSVVVMYLIIIMLVLSSCMPAAVETIQPILTMKPNSTVPPLESAIPIASDTSVPPTSIPPTPIPVVQSLEISLSNATQIEEFGQVFQSSPYRVRWALDDNSFGVISQDQVIQYDVESLISIGAYFAEEPEMLFDFSADGNILAVTSDQITIELRDIHTGEILGLLEPPDMFMDVVFSPDGQSLVTTSFEEIAASFWDFETAEILSTQNGFETAAPTYRIEFSPDGQYLFWIARSQVQVMEIENEQLGSSFFHEDFVESVAISHDGQVLTTAAAGTLDDTFSPMIFFWDATSGDLLGEVVTENIATGMAFSKDGSMLVVSDGGKLLFLDAASRENVFSMDAHSEPINSLAISPDGRTLATTSIDDSVRLWQVLP